MSNEQRTDREALIAGGFVPTMYEGQDGEFLVRKVRVGEMPYAAEHLVDDDFIWADSEAVVEVGPDNQVQLYIHDSDYLEGPVAVESEEGRALIADAIAATAAEAV